jgi:tRNA pseudouridine55 synthase
MNGYVLVDKPAGPSSHAAVQQVRRALGIGGRRGTKGGHAGTLDPFASGLLVVLLGKATRLMPYVVGHDKRYSVKVRFGASSDTDDRDGTLEPSDAPLPSQEAVWAAVVELARSTTQVPPAVSAIHVDGERAYRRVRRGETIEVPSRPVRFDSIDMVGFEEGSVSLDVRCATGTYMRALARDLGEAVGCPAYCERLRRLEVGDWAVEGATDPGDVEPRHIRDALELVPDLPRLQLDESQLADVASGRRLTADPAVDSGQVALVAPDGSLAGLGEVADGTSLVQPRIVLVEIANHPSH